MSKPTIINAFTYPDPFRLEGYLFKPTTLNYKNGKTIIRINTYRSLGFSLEKVVNTQDVKNDIEFLYRGYPLIVEELLDRGFRKVSL